MKLATKEVYVADDGTEFLNENECREHESKVQKNLSRLHEIAFFRVTHMPDLTEGRGWYGLTFLAVDGSCLSEQWAADFCFWMFGRPIQFAQSVAPMAGWMMEKTTLEAFKKWPQESISVGDHKYQADAFFLSDGEPIEGMPKPAKLRWESRP